MLPVFGWLVVLVLLAVWSLVAWAFHAVGAWTLANVGGLAGAGPGLRDLRLPEWLSPWVPPGLADGLVAWLAGLGPVVDGLLQSAPGLAAGLTIAAWAVWAIGSLLLVVLGIGLHWLLTRLRDRVAGGALPARRRTPATG